MTLRKRMKNVIVRRDCDTRWAKLQSKK